MKKLWIAVAHTLECRACEPHTCVCGKAVDTRGLHGLHPPIGLQEKCTETATPESSQRHPLASLEACTDSRSQRTSGFDPTIWETSRWHHHPPLVERQAISLGRCQIHMQKHMWWTQPERREQQPTTQRPTRTPSTASYLTLVCSFRWP